MKTMCPPGYHHNGFVATHALGHMIYIYIYIYYISCTYIYNNFSQVHRSSSNSLSPSLEKKLFEQLSK